MNFIKLTLVFAWIFHPIACSEDVSSEKEIMIKLKFHDAQEKEYKLNDLKDLDYFKYNESFMYAADRKTECNEAIVYAEIEIFEMFLDLCNERKTSCDIDDEDFHPLLTLAGLMQVRGEKANCFCDNVIRNVLLGDNSKSILEKNAKEVFDSIICTRMLLSFGKIFQLDLRVSEKTGTLCSGTYSDSKYGDVINEPENIVGIRILPSVFKSIFRELERNALLWIVLHMGVRSLNVSGCEMSGYNISTISYLDLQELDMSWCKLEQGSLVPIGNSVTMQKSLRILKVRDNKLGLSDMKAIGKLSLQDR